jgi:FdhE protein
VTGLDRLRNLAATDPALAPMAVLQVEALEAARDPIWERGVPDFDNPVEGAIPLLHGTTLGVDAERTAELVRRLATAAAKHAGVTARDAVGSSTLAVRLLETSIVRDTAGIQTLAEEVGVEINLLATLGSVAAVPLLQAVARRAAPIVARSAWDESYCPVCGVWPTLAELRGLERQRWLRCGRCGTGWAFRAQVCVFCGCADHKELGYLAANGSRDSQRAETCDCCHSYLKTMATLGPLQPDEVLLRDIDSVELDIAALQQGYGRPEKQAFALNVHLTPIKSSNGWQPSQPRDAVPRGPAHP